MGNNYLSFRIDDNYNFRVEFLEKAKKFLDSLDEKARRKVLYNVRKASITNDKNLFIKLKDEIWNSEQNIINLTSDFLRFGTKLKKRIQW